MPSLNSSVFQKKKLHKIGRIDQIVRNYFDSKGNMVGTVRENVMRILNKLKEKGVLSTRGRKIIIHEVRQLISIANHK